LFTNFRRRGADLVPTVKQFFTPSLCRLVRGNLTESYGNRNENSHLESCVFFDESFARFRGCRDVR
jgi:hypothetical protein